MLLVLLRLDLPLHLDLPLVLLRLDLLLHLDLPLHSDLPLVLLRLDLPLHFDLPLVLPRLDLLLHLDLLRSDLLLVPVLHLAPLVLHQVTEVPAVQ